MYPTSLRNSPGNTDYNFQTQEFLLSHLNLRVYESAVVVKPDKAILGDSLEALTLQKALLDLAKLTPNIILNLELLPQAQENFTGVLIALLQSKSQFGTLLCTGLNKSMLQTFKIQRLDRMLQIRSPEAECIQEIGLQHSHVSPLRTKQIESILHSQATAYWNDMPSTSYLHGRNSEDSGPILSVNSAGDLTYIKVLRESIMDSTDESREFAALLKALPMNPGRVVVDLQRMTYLDTEALGALITTLSKAKRSNVKLELRNLQPSVLESLKIKRLDHLFAFT